MTSSKIDYSINYTKALGILLMVLGHCGCSVPYSVQFLSMFHMPLFFFVSGYCFKRSNLSIANAGKYSLRKIKGLYWPFVKWGMLFLLLHNCFYYANIYSNTYGYKGGTSTLYSVRDIIIKCYFIVTRMQGEEQLLGGYWFLAALFSGIVVSWVVLHFIKKTEYSAMLVFIMSIFLNIYRVTFDGLLCSICGINFPVPFIDLGARAFEVAFFITVGLYFAEKKLPCFNWLMIFVGYLVTFVGSFFWKINPGEMFFENVKYVPYLLTGIIATWCTYSMFNKIKLENGGGKLLNFIGSNTLTILTWHFLSFKIVSLLIILMYDLNIQRLSEFPVIEEYALKGWWIIYFLFAILSCCVLAYCNKYIKSPWLKL